MTIKTETKTDIPPTPLAERLLQLISDHGPITVGDFLADALSHPQHGYYSTRDPFGTQGDFTTAPEISQIFGELIGAWLIESWEAIGAPSIFQLVEFGPGRGTLMKDILRVGQLRPKFLEAARITMIENSGRLRHAQQRALAEAHPNIVWRTSLDDIPNGPLLVVANEFFDCLPIRQFVKVDLEGDHPWRERLVGKNEHESGLAFELPEAAYPDPAGAPSPAPVEAIFESSDISRRLVEDLSDRLFQNKGRVLIIDYGHGRSGFGDTFQAVKRHEYCHPLETPGEVDITAHVDFAALARAGRSAGARVDGPVRQGDFLNRLGFTNRLDVLARAAGDEAENLVTGARRLIHPEEMGELFKVLCLSSPGMAEPAGFS